MITIRLSKDRGHVHSDWLESFHTFSFGDYYDSDHMGFSHLRVINQDTIQPGQGFGMHSHHDMEIITYVTQGELTHKDSLGTGSVIKPGEIQRMSAGKGIRHSEFNHSKTDTVKLLQIWIMPNQKGVESSYEQKTIPVVKNEWILLASSMEDSGLVKIHQDAKLYVVYLNASTAIDYRFKDATRCGWLQVVQGAVLVNGKTLSAGDGAAVVDEPAIQVQSKQNAELLWFDLLR
jgi:redox-sensitive bicupin YhaK (pirin superfamily)